ncbi:MAG: hypothetical protein ABJB85_08345 [Nitrososphaerota archaeon]
MEKASLILVLVSLLLLISVSSITIPISAQLDLSNLEEQLKLAKEKVEQTKADPTTTVSNLTLDQDLSNMTLTQEQTNQIEKEPQLLIQCIERMNLNKDPGILCNTFADYLSDKCIRFDNLLDYCIGGLLGLYGSKMQQLNEFKKAKLIELKKAEELRESCTASPPAFNDVERVKSCMMVTTLNSSYTNIPPILSITPVESFSKIEIDLIAENPGFNPLSFKNITYAFFKEGKKVSSGCVAQPVPCRSPPSQEVGPFSTVQYPMEYSIDRTQNQTLLNGLFVVNGTYYFHFPNSTIDGKYFNFNITNVE